MREQVDVSTRAHHASEAAGRALVATDLDRTLIYSAAAAALADDDLVVVERLDGRVISSATPRTLALLHELAAVALVVPATTRTAEQYRRVDVVVSELAPRYAVVANGGDVLVDGVVDPDWHDAVRGKLAAGSEPLHAARDGFFGVSGPEPVWLTRLREVDDLFLVASVDRAQLPAALVADLASALGHRGWAVSLQETKLYVVPLGLDKADAITHLRERTGAPLVIALGDSVLDRGMLAVADVGLRPAHGELSRVADAPGTIPVPGTHGARAAEEMLTAALAAARAVAAVS
jgi:hypothetical protein